MSAADALITAMHTAGGSTPRLVSEWLTLAQEHTALRDAFRAAFGKRLPTPQKLGLWLSERMGKTAGPLRLEGRHSARRKAWIYRVVDHVKIAELARQEAERQAQLRVQFEESQRQRAAAVQAHEPPPEYEYEQQQYRDGVPLPRQILIDPRNGEPIPKRRQVAEQPKTSEPAKPASKAKVAMRTPKIFDNGRWRPMTPEETTLHQPRGEAGRPLREPMLFAGPFPGIGVSVGSGEYAGPFGYYTHVAGG